MSDQKLEKLNKVFQLLKEDTISPAEVEKFLKFLLQFVTETKNSIEKLSLDKLEKIEAISDKFSSDYKDITAQIKEKLEKPLIQKVIEKTEVIREQPIIKTEVKEIVKEVIDLSKVTRETANIIEKELPKFGEQFRDGLELLEGEDRLDSSAIKNLDKYIKKEVVGGWGNGGVIGIKGLVAGTSITIDTTNVQYPVISSSASGGEWGEITGTLSDQTDLQTALDLKADTSDLASYVPYTGATTDVDLGANDLRVDGNIGIGADPVYHLDIRKVGGGAVPTTTVHLGDDGDGGFLQTASGGDITFGGGGFWNGDAWQATNADYSSAQFAGGNVLMFTDEGLTPGNTFTPSQRFSLREDGRLGIGQTQPSAVLHIKPGTATAGTAPFKLSSGTLLTAAEAGAIEFLTDDFYMTQTTNTERNKVAFVANGDNIISNQVFS